MIPNETTVWEDEAFEGKPMRGSDVIVIAITLVIAIYALIISCR